MVDDKDNRGAVQRVNSGETMPFRAKLILLAIAIIVTALTSRWTFPLMERWMRDPFSE